MLKSKLSNFLRKLNLLRYTDLLRFETERVKNSNKNLKFKHTYTKVELPPDYLIYESFQLDYDKYYNGGKLTAMWLVDIFAKHISLKDKKVLDWGCGPGRIIRHLPSLLDQNCQIYGTDYNEESIKWCQANLRSIQFNLNNLEAKLPYDNNFIDIIYGISIFTHLSEKAHYDWYNELFRILKPGGIMLFTLQGDNFKVKLTTGELNRYQEGGLVLRGDVKEGHRTYSAFHPENFVKSLFNNVEILEHVVEKPDNKSVLPQDIWILKKI